MISILLHGPGEKINKTIWEKILERPFIWVFRGGLTGVSSKLTLEVILDQSSVHIIIGAL